MDIGGTISTKKKKTIADAQAVKNAGQHNAHHGLVSFAKLFLAA